VVLLEPAHVQFHQVRAEPEVVSFPYEGVVLEATTQPVEKLA
jgi:hypothetical protein